MSLELDFESLDSQFDDKFSSPLNLTKESALLNEADSSKRSILKASDLDNLIVLNTPVHKNLKVSFAATPLKPRLPSIRYDDIRELDEEENWVERTSVLTKHDHSEYLECAKEILDQLIDKCVLISAQDNATGDPQETLVKESPLKTVDIEDRDQLEVKPEVISQTPAETIAVKSENSDPSDQVVAETESHAPTETSLAECDIQVKSEPCLDSPIKTNSPQPANMSDSPPLPARGAYQIDWDNFDESAFNPFTTTAAISNSPPRSDPMEIPIKPPAAAAAAVDENENSEPVLAETPPRKVSPTKKSPKKKKKKPSPAKESPQEIEAPVNPADLLLNTSLPEVVVEPTEVAVAPPSDAITNEEPSTDSCNNNKLPDANQPSVEEVVPAVEEPSAPQAVQEHSDTPVSEPTVVEEPNVPHKDEEATAQGMNSSDETDSGIEFKVPALPEPKVNLLSGAGDSTASDDVPSKNEQDDNYDTADEGHDEFEEEFRPASEDMFGDAAAFDMLEKFGGGDGGQHSRLARESLYVKFDPLVGSASSNTHPTTIPAPAAVPQSLLKKLEILNEENDDLLMMNTPEKTPMKLTRDPDLANKTIDRLFERSPMADYSEVVGGESGRDSPSLMSSVTEEIVKVCNYSDADLEKLRRDLELDFQARLLAKERDWDRKLKEKDTLLAVQTDQVGKLSETNVEMKKIVSEYETTINQLISDNENKSSASQESLTDLVKERDQALSDLSSVEKAFSDLHRRYEKLKEAIEGFKKNEEILKKCVEDHQGKLKRWEQKYAQLKQHAEEKLDIANEEIDKVKRTTAADNARLQAAMKKSELQIESLENSLEQKVRENKELTAICDELISKVGDGS